MKSKQPLVSVIMPVYNAGIYLVEAIESILNQTYQNFELIIVNDGSTDQSGTIINFYLQRYPEKIKAYHLPKNWGESAAANYGFQKSKGEFIARMDADDIAKPEKIKKQVDYLLAHPEVIVLGTQAEVINESGELIGKKLFPKTHEKIYQLYGIYHPMLHPSCIFRRRLLPEKDKLWENTHEPNDDYITLFRFLNHGKFANLPEALVQYRIHQNNKSLRNAKKKIFNFFKIRWDAYRKFDYKPTSKAIFINFVQLMGTLVLPERLIVPVYMLARGMVSSDQSFLKFFVRINLSSQFQQKLSFYKRSFGLLPSIKIR